MNSDDLQGNRSLVQTGALRDGHSDANPDTAHTPTLKPAADVSALTPTCLRPRQLAYGRRD